MLVSKTGFRQYRDDWLLNLHAESLLQEITKNLFVAWPTCELDETEITNL